MLQPKRTKYRKVQKSRNRGLSYVSNKVSFGEYGLKATTHGHLTARQIESARRCITRFVKRGGKVVHCKVVEVTGSHFPQEVCLEPKQLADILQKQKKQAERTLDIPGTAATQAQ